MLRQKIKKLEVAALYGDHLHDKAPQELLMKWRDNATYPSETFPKGSKFELVQTVEDGWMDGRGEKHILSYVRNPKKTYIFRGSLSRAFDIVEA